MLLELPVPQVLLGLLVLQVLKDQKETQEDQMGSLVLLEPRDLQVLLELQVQQVLLVLLVLLVLKDQKETQEDQMGSLVLLEPRDLRVLVVPPELMELQDPQDL